MDSISLLGPPIINKSINQEDFDARFNFIRYRKKKRNMEVAKHIFVKSNWRNYNKFADILPVIKWIVKYDIKNSLAKDILGSILIACLILPQAIGVGVLIENVQVGIFSAIIPQYIYILFGSARHSSIGSLSYTSFLIHCSLKYSQSQLNTLTFLCGLIQLIHFIFPLDFLFGLLSDHILLGFSLGLFCRIFILFVPQMIVFHGPPCSSLIQTLPNDEKDASCLQCLSSWKSCLLSNHFTLLCVSSLSLLIYLSFKVKLSSMISSRIGTSIPYQLIILVLITTATYFLGVLQQTRLIRTEFSVPILDTPYIPSISTFLDSLSISYFSLAAHMKISKSIAMEKMHKVHRKQELLSFSLISLICSPLGLIPPSSSPANSQINIETAKYSLISNILSTIWIFIIFYTSSSLMKYIPLCAVMTLILTSFFGLSSDMKTMKNLWYTNKWDAFVCLSSFCCSLFIINSNKGFLIAISITLFTLVMRLQWPKVDVLVRVSDVYFAEEKRYEGECIDSPTRIIRISSPILFCNCEYIRREIYRQAVIVKGLIGIGIGTRTASLRSQCAVGPKDSLAARSSVNLTNIVITHENDQQNISNGDSSTLRFMILDCSGIPSIDTESMNMITQVYFDLQNDHIKMLFCGVNATIRDSFECTAFHTQVPRAAFFPSLSDALGAARLMIMPFHMSVSMNGCRDVIALSTATSNQELAISRNNSPEAV